MARRNPKKAQKRILDEIKNQLILQAERWGKKDFYTPIKLEDMELAQCHKIVGDLLAEKSNIEYELNLLDSDKKDVLIKLERLEAYIKRAQQTIKKHEKTIHRMINKNINSKDAVRHVLKGQKPKSTVSIMVGN